MCDENIKNSFWMKSDDEKICAGHLSLKKNVEKRKKNNKHRYYSCTWKKNMISISKFGAMTNYTKLFGKRISKVNSL
jgi:hypothetical protein